MRKNATPLKEKDQTNLVWILNDFFGPAFESLTTHCHARLLRLNLLPIDKGPIVASHHVNDDGNKTVVGFFRINYRVVSKPNDFALNSQPLT